MTAKFIGLCGKCGSGKDTAAEMIRELFPGVYKTVTFAKKVREVVEVLSGIPPEVSQTTEGKNAIIFRDSGAEMTCGKLQQLIGNGLRELLFPSLWIYLATTTANESEHIIITDVRYPNEVEYIQSKGGIVIRLNGDPGKIRELNLTGRDLAAPSEVALDNFENFDHIIENSGTLDKLRLLLAGAFLKEREKLSLVLKKE